MSEGLQAEFAMDNSPGGSGILGALVDPADFAGVPVTGGTQNQFYMGGNGSMTLDRDAGTIKAHIWGVPDYIADSSLFASAGFAPVCFTQLTDHHLIIGGLALDGSSGALATIDHDPSTQTFSNLTVIQQVGTPIGFPTALVQIPGTLRIAILDTFVGAVYVVDLRDPVTQVIGTLADWSSLAQVRYIAAHKMTYSGGLPGLSIDACDMEPEAFYRAPLAMGPVVWWTANDYGANGVFDTIYEP